MILVTAPGSDLVDTENLTTLCVAVPKFSQKDWLESYETLAQFVVHGHPKVEGGWGLRTVHRYAISSCGGCACRPRGKSRFK